MAYCKHCKVVEGGVLVVVRAEERQWGPASVTEDDGEVWYDYMDCVDERETVDEYIEQFECRECGHAEEELRNLLGPGYGVEKAADPPSGIVGFELEQVDFPMEDLEPGMFYGWGHEAKVVYFVHGFSEDGDEILYSCYRTEDGSRVEIECIDEWEPYDETVCTFSPRIKVVMTTTAATTAAVAATIKIPAMTSSSSTIEEEVRLTDYIREEVDA